MTTAQAYRFYNGFFMHLRLEVSCWEQIIHNHTDEWNRVSVVISSKTLERFKRKNVVARSKMEKSVSGHRTIADCQLAAVRRESLTNI